MAGKTLPAFPAHAQPAILRTWQEAQARYDMERLSALLAFCEGNFPHEMPVMRGFDAFFVGELNKLLCD